MKFSSFRDKLLPVTIILCCGMFLLVEAYAGTFSRYIADDYCVADIARQQGILGSITWWYQNWTGKFTYLILEGIIGNAEIGVVKFLPLLVLVSWVLVTIWTLYQIALILRINRPLLMSILFSVILLYAVFAGAPSIVQSLYWVGGIVPYTSPLIWFTLYIGFLAYILRRNQAISTPMGARIIAFILAFVAGGLSEVFDSFQIVALGLIGLSFVVFALPSLKRRTLSLLIPAICGAILALIIMLAAPGNAIRQATLGAPLPLHLVILRVLLTAILFIATSIGLYSSLPLFAALVLPIILLSQVSLFDSSLYLPPRRIRSLLALSIGCCLTLIIVAIGPPIYSTSAAPDTRILFIPYVILVCTTIFWGCVIGLSIKQSRVNNQKRALSRGLAVIVIVLIVGPVLSSWNTLSHISEYRIFAAESDNRDQLIRSASANGSQNVEVKALSVDMANLAKLDVIGSDPTQWVNVCAANYYGVKTIATVETINE